MQTIKLIAAIAIPLVIGGIAGMFTAQSIPDWYSTLNQPSFNPPNWVFGPVWTILYIVMGISMYMIWIEPNSQLKTIALTIFFVQLLLNFAWSFLFFYFKNIGGALIEIIFLWLSIVAMLIIFYKIKPIAAYINIPYLLWVSFATALNTAYYKLNIF